MALVGLEVKIQDFLNYFFYGKFVFEQSYYFGRTSSRAFGP